MVRKNVKSLYYNSCRVGESKISETISNSLSTINLNSVFRDVDSVIKELNIGDYNLIVVETSNGVEDVASVLKVLRFAKRNYPMAIRIVITDTPPSKKLLSSIVSYTHRVLVNSSQIVNYLENTVFMYMNLDTKRIKKIVSKIDFVPTLPTVYQQLMEQIDNEEFSLKDASDLISNDVGMSTNILKHVNYLNGNSPITSIAQAVSLLGLDTIKAISIASEIFSVNVENPINHFSVENLTKHSLLTAHFAKKIVEIELEDSELEDIAFITGLLHDIGSLILAYNFPKKYEAVLERVYSALRPLCDVERNLLGISHAELGAHLLSLWGFPMVIVKAVAYHEGPKVTVDESFDVLQAIFIGSYFAHLFEESLPYGDNYVENFYEINSIEELSRFELWKSECHALYEEFLELQH